MLKPLEELKESTFLLGTLGHGKETEGKGVGKDNIYNTARKKI